MNTQKTTRNEKVTRSKAKMGCSNVLHAVLNFLSLLGSLPCIGLGIWLATRHGSECLRSLLWPIIAVGLFIFVFSLIGIIGALLRIKALLWFYLAISLLTIVALLGIAAFAFSVTSRGSGEAVEGKAYEDYYLDDYSDWMQHELRRPSHWAKIKKCIEGEKVCKELKYTNPHSFFNASLSPLESGCCKPPTACELTFVNATNWIPNKDANSTTDADCKTWSNDPSELCYDCDSCRAGVAENTRLAWSKMARACAVILVYMILVYSLGCCAVKNDKNRYYEKRKVVTNSKNSGYSEKSQDVVQNSRYSEKSQDVVQTRV